MKTPITDNYHLAFSGDKPMGALSRAYCDIRKDAAMLELDRAALLEFAIRVRNTTSSSRIKREAAAVIAEARANFPEP